MKYLRIHVEEISQWTGKPYGLFAAVGKLVDRGFLTPEEVEEYRRHYGWFEANLPNPPFYADRNSIKATTWYKNNPQALDMIERMAFYFGMCEKYGVRVLTSESDDPGRIVYEDEYQIGVLDYNGH